MVHTELYGVVVDRQAPSAELDVANAQSDCLAPADARVGEGENEGTMPARLTCESTNVIGREIDVPLGGLARQILDTPGQGW